MTLSRKLTILVSLLFLAVFTGTLAITVNNQRAYLIEQLGSHAQDAATALGITLGPAIQNGDTAAVMSFVSAMADGGYYQRIRILDQQGRALVDNHPALAVNDVPSWFLQLVPLQGPERKALVTSGWHQAGTVIVSSHPGYAYKELWRIFLNMSAWFSFAWFSSVLLVSGFIRLALRPLEDMERQALAIAEGRFLPAQKLPDTRELKRVVTVMNRMSESVEKMILDKTALIKRMERELHVDAVTGFATREYFLSQLKHLLDGGELYAGAFFLLRLHDLGSFNDRHGFPEGNKRLQAIARLLRSIFEKNEHHLFARFRGAELAVFVPLLTENETGQYGEAIRSGFEALADEEWPVIGHLGIAMSGDGDLSTVFSTVDMALGAAQAKGPNAWHQFSPDVLRPEHVLSGSEWRALLGNAERKGCIVLRAQPVVFSETEAVLHHEIFPFLASPDGSQLPASVFMPMAKRLDLATHIDKIVIVRTLSLLDKAFQKPVYSINLSMASIGDSLFRDWLREQLFARPALAPHLIFELHSPETEASEALLGEFIRGLQSTGCGFLLGRCLEEARFPDCLSTLPVTMVKLDRSYGDHIQEGATQRLLEAVKDVAHVRGIAIIATGIENQEQQKAARQLGFDGLQGEFIGPLVALETGEEPASS